MRAWMVPLVLVLVGLAGCLGADDPAVTETPVQGTVGPAEDAVVVAVVDLGGFNPYHFDWRNETLPQHLDDDPTHDLPLDRPPHTYLPGFPDPASFADYRALQLTLSEDPEAITDDLIVEDSGVWSSMAQSEPEAIAYHHVPGTKIIGFVDFGGPFPAVTNSTAHGARAASAAAGNLFGTCPECLVVFVHNDGTDAPLEWAQRQPWIDVVTNSYGYAEPATGTRADRHFIYDGCDTELQRETVERGQSYFFGASNGLDGFGLLTGTTWQSCQFGTDWVFTVGGISPSGSSQNWASMPADLAAPSEDYPTQDDLTINGSGTMGGTSVASPVSAGTYANALRTVREVLPGPSRIQEAGIVARGDPIACGQARPDCELGDGVLTGEELRTAFLQGAEHTPQGLELAPAEPEQEFLSEGHGSYWGRFHNDAGWQAETARIIEPMLGQTPAPDSPDGMEAWFIVDSWCRQQIWGSWSAGHYVEGETELPGPDPAWPLRSAYLAGCPDELLPQAEVLP